MLFDWCSFGGMTIGAVQPCFRYVLADFVALQECRRKQARMSAWLAWRLDMPFWVLGLVLPKWIISMQVF